MGNQGGNTGNQSRNAGNRDGNAANQGGNAEKEPLNIPTPIPRILTLILRIPIIPRFPIPTFTDSQINEQIISRGRLGNTLVHIVSLIFSFSAKDCYYASALAEMSQQVRILYKTPLYYSTTAFVFLFTKLRVQSELKMVLHWFT